MVFSALNPRNRSLPRGTALVLGSLVLAFLLAGFPEDRASLKLLIPTLRRAGDLGHHTLPAASLELLSRRSGGADLHGHHGPVHDPLPAPVPLWPLAFIDAVSSRASSKTLGCECTCFVLK